MSQCFHFENFTICCMVQNTPKFNKFMDPAGQPGPLKVLRFFASRPSPAVVSAPARSWTGSVRAVLKLVLSSNIAMFPDGGCNLRLSKSMMYLHNIYDTPRAGPLPTASRFLSRPAPRFHG